MIVSPQEYNSMLHRLKDPNEFSGLSRLPKDEYIYNINLDERKIETPAFLSVESDIDGEIIWFKVNRFYDNIDLYSGACWIFYTNALGESCFYRPMLQIASSDVGDDFLLVPWAISENVAKKNGDINFSIQFFKMSEDNLRFLYVINTQPAKSKILTSLAYDPTAFLLDDEKLEDEVIPDRKQLSADLRNLAQAYQTLAGSSYNLYWIDID